MQSIWLDLMGTEVRFVGKRYRTRIIEAGEGEPLILAHGGGGHAEHYSRNILRLAQHFHVIAFDSLWHGYSSAPDPGPDPMLLFSEQILDLLDTMGIEKANIGGASAGAFAPLWLALNRPERVDKLVLIVPGHIQYPSDAASGDRADYSQLRTRTLAALDDVTPSSIRSRLEWLMADPSVVTDELVDVRAKIYGSLAGNQATRTYYGFNSSELGHAHDFSRQELEGLRVPTMVLWATGGNGVAPERGEWLASVLPNVRHRVIEGAGHWPQWERPEEHDNAIIDFINEPS